MAGKGSPAAYSAKKIFAWTFGSLALLIFHRILFVLLHWPPETPAAGQVLDQLLFGLSFDIATLPLLILPLVLFLPLYALGRSGLNRVLRWLEYGQWIYLCALNLILLASTYNFTFNDKHLGWEFTAYFNDLGTLLGGISERSPLMLAGWAFLLPGLIGGGIWWLARRPAAPLTMPAEAAPATDWGWRAGIKKYRGLPILFVSYLALIVLLVVAVRGGVQESPVRSPDAIRYDTSFLNTIPLNGLFTISRDAQDRSDFLKFYDQNVNTAYVRGLLDQPAAFISDDYPLVRRMPAKATLLPGGQRAPNVVLIVLESFTAKYLAVHGGDPEIAPEFHRLMQQGRYYDRFMASGGRSANGIFCMLAGLPDRANRTILRSNESANRMGGLAKILNRKGYRSVFVHGGDLRFDSMDRMLPHLGFDEAYGWREMEAQGLVQNSNIGRSAWGYQDGDSFRVLEQRMDALHSEDPARPVFASIFTLNTHHPFLIPDESFAFFEEETAGEQRDFLNSYRYTDQMLGDFMRAMRDKPYFNDTIFLFTADHAHHRGLNYLEDRHIPLLIFAPGKIAAQRVPEIANQLDVLPTILGLAGGDVQYAAMGRDLLEPFRARPNQAVPFAYYAGGSNTGVIGWVEGERLLMQWIGTPHFIVMTARHPADQTNLYDSDPEAGDAMLHKSRHFHQFARYLEQSNRIFPPNAGSETETNAEAGRD
ncbi:MAG: sulfatase-like hydrolase/transferase [bacterium]|nr:sulfatase-like hydrolase/transferase [bacterium]